MQTFSAARDAKEFLVGRIVSQAQRDGVSLSEVERKILYFSETAWTLPDIAEVNEEFDSNYDQGAFERKIASIVRNIQRAQTPDKGDWDEAVLVLRSEDHYHPRSDGFDWIHPASWRPRETCVARPGDRICVRGRSGILR